MKPKSFTITKNSLILTLLTILSGVIVFTQIRYRRLETQLKTIVSSFPIMDHINPDDIPDTLTTMSYAMPDYDSILEANKLLKKKVDFYFEYYRKSKEIEPDTFEYWKYPSDLKYYYRMLPDTIWNSPIYPYIKPHPFPMDSVWRNISDSIKRTFIQYNYL